ncbi:acyl-coenzyme A synthetase ACSM1, mitochondrial-like isoform X7 [Mirounga angustirostris]|uniref:acyl-coenzyme A synthetase ACSM1, mitochondrial-like isoform X7 n=1 Tax=Mirounga angustirostris TaxID=9716 RepID=UPI00313E5407
MIPLSPVSLRFPTLEHSLLPEDQEQWRKRTGLLLYEVYGQSETGGNHRQPGAGPRSSFLDAHVDSTQGVSCVTLRGMKIKPGSIGKGIPSFDVQIIDDKGNSLPFNTEGNIGIRMKPTKPIGLFMGYEDNPVKTAKVECGDFYNSGDRATMDEEGYIWFLGRNDDIINASGDEVTLQNMRLEGLGHPALAATQKPRRSPQVPRRARRGGECPGRTPGCG